jgi:HSP20 family protein
MTMMKSDPLGFDWPDRWRRWLDFGAEGDRMMRVEELHEDDAIVIRAEMPGIDPDHDVVISIADGVVHIAAHREEHHEHTHQHRYHSEFHYGEFSRDVMLPAGIDASNVTATYKDGVLEVRVPRLTSAREESTKVPVRRM